MSEKGNQNQIDKLKKQFASNNKGNKPGGPKKSKFNFYWVYAIVFALFIGMQVFSAMSFRAKKSNFQDFEQSLELGDVERVNIVNEKTIQVYIREESLADSERYEEVRNSNLSKEINPGPHYVFEMPASAFEKRLTDFYADRSREDEITVKYETRENFLGDIIGWVLPLLLMIGVWVFIMRRMSGGGGAAGGGGGSQIFNIGKSRAKVFDKDTEVKTTFDEVAGMTGAKEEVLEIVDFLKNPKICFSSISSRILVHHVFQNLALKN